VPYSSPTGEDYYSAQYSGRISLAEGNTFIEFQYKLESPTGLPSAQDRDATFQDFLNYLNEYPGVSTNAPAVTGSKQWPIGQEVTVDEPPE
jgi:hypothetical protein